MPRSLLVAGVGPKSVLRPLPLFAKGFRPFFLLAALYAVLIVPVWLAIWSGLASPGGYLPLVSWHAHEMLSGFALAVIAGFLLTAVGNWTGRETAQGASLGALALLWVAGRVAMLASGTLPRGVVALVDLAFVPALGLCLAPPLLAARDRRNFVMLAVLGVLFATNAVVHLTALGVLEPEAAAHAHVVALDVIVLLISIIGGRVFPMFTRNATGVSSIRSLPWLDRACLGAIAMLTCADALAPGLPQLAALLAATAGLLAAARALHWGARHSLRSPLLWILHGGYAWLVIGLLLRGASGLFALPVVGSAPLHALTVGAVGSLALGMMARVALGHTGRMLAAPRPMALAFAALLLSATVRVFGPWVAPSAYQLSLLVSGALWALGFAIFLGCYTSPLLSPRVDGKPG